MPGPATYWYWVAAVALPPRVISSVSPAAGSPGGGTPVTLTGSNFTQATAVRFGPNFALSYTVVSATQITAVSPPGSGTVQIGVTTPAGRSNGVAFGYAAAPARSGRSAHGRDHHTPSPCVSRGRTRSKPCTRRAGSSPRSSHPVAPSTLSPMSASAAASWAVTAASVSAGSSSSKVWYGS
ncbi:hypothetical protein G4H13_34215 [Streptomyces rapamycinicus]|uniref:IPT/TIG domain-containing protein n=1 Tax=Streptomyces rhizosphaericus TaxID=114699 RepID=A0A6G4AR77_9ACTN|nr:hypothetical protein [Streptomyces rhizosphaericus]